MEERDAVRLPLAQTALVHIALPGWGAPRTALDFSQTNKITNIHAIQSRNQTGQTDTTQQHRNQQTCTQPHNPYSPKANNKQQHTEQLAMQTLSDRVGLQTAPRQKQLRPHPN